MMRCRSSAVEEYRLCPRRAPGDVACQATLGPRATDCVGTKVERSFLAGRRFGGVSSTRMHLAKNSVQLQMSQIGRDAAENEPRAELSG